VDTPSPPQVAPDPMFKQLGDQAQQDQTDALKSLATADAASLMARYGARLAMAGTTGTSPLIAAMTPRSIASTPYGR
jgi:hypothetical protein